MNKKNTAPATADAAAPDVAVTEQAQPNEPPTPPEEPPALPEAEADVEVVVLVRHGDHDVDDVITLPESAAAIAVRDGWADDAPAAIAFAKSLAD